MHPSRPRSDYGLMEINKSRRINNLFQLSAHHSLRVNYQCCYVNLPSTDVQLLYFSRLLTSTNLQL